MSKGDVLDAAAKAGRDSWVCWACGGDVARPVVKRRRERRTRRWQPGCEFAYGVYHYRCKARWDA